MEWLQDGAFSTALPAHLTMTDSEVLSGIRTASSDQSKPGHFSARRIASREHFRLVYEMHPSDLKENPRGIDLREKALQEEIGETEVRRDSYAPGSSGVDFPVQARDGRIHSSRSLSKTLQSVPGFAVDCLYVSPPHRAKAEKLLKEKRAQILNGTTDQGNV